MREWKKKHQTRRNDKNVRLSAIILEMVKSIQIIVLSQFNGCAGYSAFGNRVTHSMYQYFMRLIEFVKMTIVMISSVTSYDILLLKIGVTRWNDCRLKWMTKWVYVTRGAHVWLTSDGYMAKNWTHCTRCRQCNAIKIKLKLFCR